MRKPVDGEIDLQSGFGVRIDPFLGAPAMHTGLDLHGESGDPVRATADGTVIAAGWNGGYGRVVDVDHHNGLSTRYAHLSSIDVRVGQSVKSGQIVGKVGCNNNVVDRLLILAQLHDIADRIVQIECGAFWLRLRGKT